MCEQKNIKIGDATLTPEMIGVLEEWTNRDCAELYINLIDESKDGLTEILSDFMLEGCEEFKKILIHALRTLVIIKKDLKCFDLSEGGES